LYLNDPDGLGIEIYRDRPRDTWRMSAGGELAMATDPLDLQSVHDEPGAETPWRGLEAGTVMGHVHLHVPHLDTAEAFYGGHIGFEPMVRGYPGALFMAAGGYHHHLGLNTWTGVGAPGDSGSPVITSSGQAAGNFTHLIVHTGYLGNNQAGMRATAILRFAGVSLVNADGSTTSGPTSNGCGTDPEW